MVASETTCQQIKSSSVNFSKAGEFVSYISYFSEYFPQSGRERERERERERGGGERSER